MATVVTIVNYDHTVITIVNYDPKTFIEQATECALKKILIANHCQNSQTFIR